MQNVTENMNEQFKQVIDMQSRAFEPMRVFATVASNAAEQVARKNYEVFGDVIESSTKQVRLALSGENPTESASAQLAEAKVFMELMNSRATEYAGLVQDISSKAKEASESVVSSFK